MAAPPLVEFKTILGRSVEISLFLLFSTPINPTGIGMPVGFIGVEKSKIKLISTDLPRIVLNSTRGELPWQLLRLTLY